MDVNATARDLSHILTDTIGMGGSVGPTIDLERFRLDDDDRVLVCTNGLTDMVDEASDRGGASPRTNRRTTNVGRSSIWRWPPAATTT